MTLVTKTRSALFSSSLQPNPTNRCNFLRLPFTRRRHYLQVFVGCSHLYVRVFVSSSGGGVPEAVEGFVVDGGLRVLLGLCSVREYHIPNAASMQKGMG